MRFPGKFRENLGAGVKSALSKKRGASLLPMVATRAKRDEISQVVRCAAGRDGLDVVNLEPAVRAAGGAASAVPPKGGLACALPLRCGANENAWFAYGAALSGSVTLALAARSAVSLVRRVDGSPAPRAEPEDRHP